MPVGPESGSFPRAFSFFRHSRASVIHALRHSASRHSRHSVIPALRHSRLPSFPPSVIPVIPVLPSFTLSVIHALRHSAPPHSRLPSFPPSVIPVKTGIHYALPYDKLPAARLYGFPLPDRGRGHASRELVATMRAYPETGTMQASPENEKALVISPGKMYQSSPRRRRYRALWYSGSGRGVAGAWYAKLSSHGVPG